MMSRQQSDAKINHVAVVMCKTNLRVRIRVRYASRELFLLLCIWRTKWNVTQPRYRSPFRKMSRGKKTKLRRVSLMPDRGGRGQ